MKFLRRLISSGIIFVLATVLACACMLYGSYFIFNLRKAPIDLESGGVPQNLRSTDRFEYAGHTYESEYGYINQYGKSIGDWRMVNESDYVIDHANLQGAKSEFKIRVYGNDPDRCFIYVEYYHTLCHRVDDPLPDYKDAQAIERIVLQTGTENPQIHSQAVIDDESEIQEFASLCSQPQIEKMYRLNSPKKSVKSLPIYVYFKDYPAYRYVGDIFIAEDGSGGLSILDLSSTTYRGRDYIPVSAGSELLKYLE